MVPKQQRKQQCRRTAPECRRQRGTQRRWDPKHQTVSDSLGTGLACLLIRGFGSSPGYEPWWAGHPLGATHLETPLEVARLEGVPARVVNINPPCTLYAVTLATVALAFGHSECDSGPWRTEDLAW